MPLPKPTTTQLALRLILFLIVMFAVLSSVLTLHRHLTDTSTHHHQKEIRDLNGEASLSYPGSYWSNATTRSLSARMDGHAADNHDHPPDRELLIAAAAGFQCFDLLVNDLMSQVSFRLAPEARGNGRDGWFFGPERHDHITDILHQLPDSLLSATFPHRDPDLWMNLDAAQDGPYMLADSEHAVSVMNARYFENWRARADNKFDNSQQTLSAMASSLTKQGHEPMSPVACLHHGMNSSLAAVPIRLCPGRFSGTSPT